MILMFTKVFFNLLQIALALLPQIDQLGESIGAGHVRQFTPSPPAPAGVTRR